MEWARRHRKLLAWTGGSLAVLLVVVTTAGYLAFRHLNSNIQQVNIRPDLSTQPLDTHPQAENILVIGSDARLGTPGETVDSTDQSDTMMLVHISADRQWAEVMSIPRDSWVHIPSCKMGNGQLSSPTQSKINKSFAIGNLYGNHTALGAACTIKTLEQNTGIYIDHFIVANFAGFKNMVSALGGVRECNPTPFSDPRSGIVLSPGYHWLTPSQALAYVRARYGLGDSSDLERITRQQAFVSSLISRARSELLDPLAVYRFLDATTGSLTIDSQLGGIGGLYSLEESLRGISASKIAMFTLPSFPRADVVPSDTANVMWKQPEDGEIFASFRDDLPTGISFSAASTAENVSPGRPGKSGVLPAASPSAPASGTPAKIANRTASQSICVA